MDQALQDYIARREKLLGEVKTILIESLKVDRPPEFIDPDTVLFGSGLGLDSVDALELVIAIEARFGISVQEDRFRTALRTVNALVDLLIAEPVAGAA